MSKWIALPRSEGLASRQAHADLPAGSFEREAGREGFAGPATHFYHQNPPTGWVDWEGHHRPRALDFNLMHCPSACPMSAPVVAYNEALKLRWWETTLAMPDLARNADGDDLLFMHSGAAEFFCDFGHLTLAQGDYLIIPRGTMWRIEPHGPIQALLLEATGESYQLPERGMLGEHALFDPGVLDVPRIDEAFRSQQAVGGRWRVRIKARGEVACAVFPFNPLDAMGWKGTLFPVRLNWRDIRPISSDRYHLPPSAHTTFVTPRFAVCSFCPRPAETDPGAIKVPFFHSNDDVDELLFLHHGNFFSRDGMGPGMMTFHPAGCTHGPHPQAYANSQTAPRKEILEMAINIDARDAIMLGDLPVSVEREGHVNSWKDYVAHLEKANI